MSDIFTISILELDIYAFKYNVDQVWKEKLISYQPPTPLGVGTWSIIK